jgi:hypothetical protein
MIIGLVLYLILFNAMHYALGPCGPFPFLDGSRRRFFRHCCFPAAAIPLVLFQLQEPPRTSVPWSALPPGCTFTCCGASAALLPLVVTKGFFFASAWRFYSLLLPIAVY